MRVSVLHITIARLIVMLTLVGCAVPPTDSRFEENVIEARTGTWTFRMSWPTDSNWRRICYTNVAYPWLGTLQCDLVTSPTEFTWEQELSTGSCIHTFSGVEGSTSLPFEERRVKLTLRHIRTNLQMDENLYQTDWLPRVREANRDRALSESGLSIDTWISNDTTPFGFMWDLQGVNFFSFGPSVHILIDVETLSLNGHPLPADVLREFRRGDISVRQHVD